MSNCRIQNNGEQVMKETVRIGDICDILNGYAFKSNEYTANGIRIIRIANVQKGYVEDLAPQFYPLSFQNEINKYMLYEGDLLVSLTGNVGRVALLPFDMLPAALNQRVACLRVKDSSKLEKSFLFYLLNTSCFERKCVEASKGVAQKNLSTEWLKNYEISLPSIQEQRRISSLLGEIDAIVHLYQQQLAKLDELVKARFVEMFGSESFPILTFGDTCVFLKNGANIKQSAGAKGYPITRIETLSNGIFNPDRLGYANITELDQYENYILQSGDILISHINSAAYLGRAVQYKGELNLPVIHGMNLLRAHIKKDYDPTYIEYYFKTSGAKKYILSITKKAVNQASLTTSDLKKMPIPIPPYKLQVDFAVFVSQVGKSKSAVKKALDKAQMLFYSLMQKYFG